MGKFVLITGLVLCVCISSSVKGNDPYFAQFFNSPMNLNPAYTGTANGSLRFNLNYRNYLYALSSYETYSYAMDMPLFENKWISDFIGLGLIVNNDVSGEAVNRLNALISMAYHKAIDQNGNHYVSLGFQGGIIQNDANFSGLSTQSQWVPGVGFDASLGNGENFSMEKVLVPELNAGLMWYMFMANNSMLYLGVSVAHLTEPNITVFEGPNSKLSRKYVGHVGSYIELNAKLGMFPAILFTQQNNQNTYNLGANFEYDISEAKQEMFLTFGPWVRNLDAVVIYGGVQWKKLQLGVSYDITISKLNQAKGNGGVEFSLSYNLRKNSIKMQKLMSNPNPQM
jgi:type IX secretion system PorP/SprF family membrane protein